MTDFGAFGDGIRDDREAIQMVFGQPVGTPGGDSAPFKYQVQIWHPYALGTSVPSAIVWSDPARVLHNVAPQDILGDGVLSIDVTVPGARSGDIVTVGPPPSIGVGLLVSGHVLPDGFGGVDENKVRLRLSNPTSGKIPIGGWWAISAGNGFRAGEPQMVEASAAAAPYPMAGSTTS